MKKGDIAVIISVFVLIIAAVLILFFASSGGSRVVITKNNEKLLEVKLNENDVIDIKTHIIVIENGEVWVEKADCENQNCVKHTPISKKGSVIACLPNRVIVEIK